MSDGRFKPGNAGGPGRPPTPEDIRDIRKYSRFEVERVFDKFLGLTKGDLLERLKHPDTPVLEAILGQIILKAISGGDQVRLGFILDRVIGKVKEEMELTMPKPTIIEYEGSRLVLTSKMGKEE